MRLDKERRSIPKINVNIIAVILHKLGSFQQSIRIVGAKLDKEGAILLPD